MVSFNTLLIAIILFMMYNDNHISMPVLLLLLIVLLILGQILKTHVFRTFNIDIKFKNDFGQTISDKLLSGTRGDRL